MIDTWKKFQNTSEEKEMTEAYNSYHSFIDNVFKFRLLYIAELSWARWAVELTLYHSTDWSSNVSKDSAVTIQKPVRAKILRTDNRFLKSVVMEKKRYKTQVLWFQNEQGI